jgi:hypothetical protein
MRLIVSWFRRSLGMLLSVEEEMISAPARVATESSDLIERNEQAVMQALSDESFDFRSIWGLSESLGLEPSVVEAVLQKHADEIRVAAVPDSKGHTLYTLRSRPRKAQERFSEALAFVSGSTR